MDDYLTKIHAVIQFRTRFPGWLVKVLLNPVATRIFKQDAHVLKLQGENIRRFGGEHYASTAIDVLGLQIARLLRLAETGGVEASGEGAPDEWSREIELEV